MIVGSIQIGYFIVGGIAVLVAGVSFLVHAICGAWRAGAFARSAEGAFARSAEKPLPPATARALRRSARSRRADISRALRRSP